MKTNERLNKIFNICINIFMCYAFWIISIIANNVIEPIIIISFLFLTIFTTFLIIYIWKEEINLTFKK